MKTKLFGLVMALCLLAGAFAGMTALADGENLFRTSPAWGWSNSSNWNESTGIVTRTGGEMFVTSHTDGIDPSGVYCFTFDYATTAEDTYFYFMHRYNGDVKPESKFGPKVVLPATGGADTYRTFTYYFIPGNGENGDPVTDKFMVFFGAPGASEINVKHGFGTEHQIIELVQSSLQPADLIPSEEGAEVKFITGGEQVTGNARVGEKMMKVTADNAMTMEFMPLTALVKFRGFMKAQNMTDGDTVKVTFYQGAVENNVVLTEKTYTFSATDTNYIDIQNDAWEYFRFSALPGGIAINVKFEVTSAEGFVYVDGVTMEEDKNIVPDPRFVDAAANHGVAGSLWEFDSATVSAGTDGNCPDGQNYLKLNGGSVSSRTTRIEVQPDERYLLSFWIKTNGDCWMGLYTFFSSEPSGYTKNGAAWAGMKNDKPNVYRMFFADTESEWKHVSLLVSTPKNLTSLRLYVSNTNQVELSDFAMEKVDEKEIRFFVPDLSDCLAAEPMDVANKAYMTYLGKPVEVKEDLKAGESAKATCLVPVLDGDTHKLSEDKMILAAYKTVNGKEQLVGIKVGVQAVVGGTDVAGVDCTSITDGFAYEGKELGYMNYPSATLTSAAFAGADSIRAFCWDSAGGLKSMADATVLR